jgi:hypothetical protein
MCGVLRANYAIFGRLFASLEGRREIFSGLGHKKKLLDSGKVEECLRH